MGENSAITSKNYLSLCKEKIIFSHEKIFPEYESNEVKLQKLCEECSYIQTKLDDLQKAGEVSEFTKSAVCVTTNHVLALIAQKYHRVQKGMENVMRGKIIEYEAKTIRNKAIAEGKAEGIAETMAKVKAEIEERAKDMLRDKMTLPLVEKYTHLPMPRIEELARGLGLFNVKEIEKRIKTYKEILLSISF